MEAALKQRALPVVTSSGDPFTLNNGVGPVSPRPRAITLIGHEGLKARGIDYSRSHLWRLEAAGRFPKRVHVGSGRVAWIQHEVDNYLSDLASARDFIPLATKLATGGSHDGDAGTTPTEPGSGQAARGCRSRQEADRGLTP